MSLSPVADSASVSLWHDSVEVAPGISVTPHNVTVSFKKKQEKVWDSLPGMGAACGGETCLRVWYSVCTHEILFRDGRGGIGRQKEGKENVGSR